MNEIDVIIKQFWVSVLLFIVSIPVYIRMNRLPIPNVRLSYN